MVLPVIINIKRQHVNIKFALKTYAGAKNIFYILFSKIKMQKFRYARQQTITITIKAQS